MLYVRFLSEFSKKDLPVAGGKGANLGELIRAGFPVPGGVCVTTRAYLSFVEGAGIQTRIMESIQDIIPEDMGSLDRASETIRGYFMSEEMPEDIEAEIKMVYSSLCDEKNIIPVAIRSSATAEDLPDLSFAGQQDTYLNIVGIESVLDGVKRCWASLWTSRAIGYRMKNNIPHENTAIAVVVQLMVQSEASGVLFTANPLTGRRTETVIDATLGLGESLVSGQVEPDHYVVDTLTERIIEKKLGKKGIVIRSLHEGGTETLDQGGQGASIQALPDPVVLALSALGRDVEKHFGTPQDMEWTWSEGTLQIVQSRPVTTLFPIIENIDSGKMQAAGIYFSFASWQGMMDPYTPMGRQQFESLATGIGKKLGFRKQQNAFVTAGERLYVNISSLVRSKPGRAFLSVFLTSIDPTSAGIVEELMKEPPFALKKGGIKGIFVLMRILITFFPVILNVIRNLSNPRRARKRLYLKIEKILERTEKECSRIETPAQTAAYFTRVINYLPSWFFPVLLPAAVSGIMPLQVLLRITGHIPGNEELVLELSRGMPHNVTTEMDISLWKTSRIIKSDPVSLDYFQKNDPEEISRQYQKSSLPAAASEAMKEFLGKYGSRGVAEIDIGRPRWKENPVHIIQVLKSYLQIDEVRCSPLSLFQQGCEKAETARVELISELKKHGRVRAKIAGMLAGRFRELGGLREMPKFVTVRFMTIQRDMLLRVGSLLSQKKKLEYPDDIFFLKNHELEKIETEDSESLKTLIRKRREAWDFEFRRKRVPRVILSDGTVFYDGISKSTGSENSLTGNPVSSGVAEGVVHVILDPHKEQLLPGEILVCPATDPAWTPLFLSAAALVMEIGGMMTHGSVVAREYGIPAVVGVPQAVSVLKNGQRIRVDGGRGVIEIL